VRNFIDLFIMYLHPGINSTGERCLKTTGVAEMPPSDYCTFKKFLQSNLCPKTPSIISEQRLTALQL